MCKKEIHVIFLNKIFKIKAIICDIHKEDKIILFSSPPDSFNNSLVTFVNFTSLVITLSLEL